MTTTFANWRSCQVTGLQVDRSAERLIIFNAVTAVLYLAFGGTLALLIALTRWQAVGLISSSEWFYRLVGAHGAAMLIFWIVFFEIAGLLFGGTVLLSTRLIAPRLAWMEYGMMLVGSLLVTWTMLTGRATVMFTAYPPLKASSWFYAGFVLFAVGALLALLHFIANLAAARARGDVQSLPLFTFALLTAAVIGIFTLVSGALAIVPVWLWSLGLVESVDPGVYRLLFWGFGHGAQQINLAAMIGIWYALASLMVGARPLNDGFSRFAFLLYALFINMGSMHHILVDPGLGTWARGINASYFMYAAVIASMIHAFTIPASIEVAQREKGIGGLFGWLRHGPWGSPGFSALILSVVLFGVFGGITGVIMGGIQMNMMIHNTLFVPGHFHMTVVAGTTLAFMGISYYVVPLICRRDLFLPGLAKWQPWLYAVGMTIWGIGGLMAGRLGVPRRHFDITYGGLPISEGVFQNPMIGTALALMGIGAIIAVLGGAAYVLIAAGTVFLGRRSETPAVGHLDAGALAPPAEVAVNPSRIEAPGTLTLASAWLLLFMLLYAASWFNLSRIPWEIR